MGAVIGGVVHVTLNIAVPASNLVVSVRGTRGLARSYGPVVGYGRVAHRGPAVQQDTPPDLVWQFVRDAGGVQDLDDPT